MRARWIEGLHADTRASLDADAEVFLHQSLSTPCLDVVERAQGPYLFTRGGQKLFDFHGNSVHQLGHGHPAVVAAVKAELDRLHHEAHEICFIANSVKTQVSVA